MMQPTIFIIGKSGAGKDMYCKMIQEQRDIAPVIQYTTRPIRDDEINGKDVNCISKEAFESLIESKQIFEHRSYNVNYKGKPDVWLYGTPSLDKNDDKIYVFAATIDIIKSAYDLYKDADMMEIIYINTSDDVREYRASHIRKSFDKPEWDRRVKADSIDFSKERFDMIENLIGKKIHIFDNNNDDAKKSFMEFYDKISEPLMHAYKERNK